MAYVSAGLSRTGGEETIHDACNDEEFGEIWCQIWFEGPTEDVGLSVAGGV